MNLESLDLTAGANAGSVLELRNPATGESTGMHVHLLGADSDVYQAEFRRVLAARMERRTRDERSKAAPDEAARIAQLEAESIDLMVAITRGWTGIERGGEPWPYSPAEARQLYTRFVWVREQVKEFVEDRANFLPGSATNSLPSPSTSSS